MNRDECCAVESVNGLPDVRIQSRSLCHIQRQAAVKWERGKDAWNASGEVCNVVWPYGSAGDVVFA